MNDEKYLFLSDCREKKNIANSARNRRTHCGKGGKVKLPSDNLSKKELEKMNGECKSYKLNDPMSWEEFRAMPDDIKVIYIKALRQRFNPPNSYLAEMMRVSGCAFSRCMKELGLSDGKSRSGRTHWDKDGFLAWRQGIKIPADETAEVVEPADEPAADLEKPEEVHIESMPEEVIEEEAEATPRLLYAIPESGNMVFNGDIRGILNSLSAMFGNAKVHMSITWDVMD